MNEYWFKFQFKERHGEFDEWKDINETLFMDNLYKYHNRLTPYIRRMLQGEVLSYPEGEYRINAILYKRDL